MTSGGAVLLARSSALHQITHDRRREADEQAERLSDSGGREEIAVTDRDLDPDVLGGDEWADAVAFIRLWIPLTVGAVAEDTENGKRVLVIETHDEQASDRGIEALEGTVAEANPAYPENDDVVTAVYLESLPDETPDQATGRVAREVRRQDFPTYDFPSSRLEVVSPDRISVGDFNEVSDE